LLRFTITRSPYYVSRIARLLQHPRCIVRVSSF
jgi:hypothetical protein